MHAPDEDALELCVECDHRLRAIYLNDEVELNPKTWLSESECYETDQ